jgi:hypothetical protein
MIRLPVELSTDVTLVRIQNYLIILKLTLYIRAVKKCIKVQNLCTIQTDCIYVIRMILIVYSDYSREKH